MLFEKGNTYNIAPRYSDRLPSLKKSQHMSVQDCLVCDFRGCFGTWYEVPDLSFLPLVHVDALVVFPYMCVPKHNAHSVRWSRVCMCQLETRPQWHICVYSGDYMSTDLCHACEWNYPTTGKVYHLSCLWTLTWLNMEVIALNTLLTFHTIQPLWLLLWGTTSCWGSLLLSP